MRRREALAGMAKSLVAGSVVGHGAAQAAGQESTTYLEIRNWRLHNTDEKQTTRLSEYLEHGFAPALDRAGARLDGAFSNVIGPDGPYFLTLAEYPSLSAFGVSLDKMRADDAHRQQLEKLSAGPGLPFVRLESSLLRSFDISPKPNVSAAEKARIFELRTYESQSFLTLSRKVGMFNKGEAGIFERLGLRPIFFGETVAGPKQPNLMYMLSYDDLAARDRLWKVFVSDPEWKKLAATPGLSDAEIVANISNAILAPLRFSAIR